MDKSNKQKLMIEYLLSSPDTYAICKPIIKPEYFAPELRQSVLFIHEYYDKYNNTPSLDLIAAETAVNFANQVITKDQQLYCVDEIELFCKRKAIEHAVIKASTLINSDDPGQIQRLIEDAVNTSLYRNTGSDYFLNVRDRLERNALSPQRISTGWIDIDELMGGGLARTEMLLLSANSGGGKSITLANLAVNMLLQKFNVLYITLELSIDLVEQRFDTMFTGIPTVNWRNNIDQIVNTVTDIGASAGELVVEHMPSGTCARDIRALLKEFELRRKYVPDVLIVDYLDIMGANEQVPVNNVHEKDKRATEQLRDILIDYNMMGASASQQNRSAIEATELHQGHIAGGISKVNTVDWYISIILTPLMKAQGEIILAFLKSRSSDAVGKQAVLKWDNTRLRITNLTKQKEPDVIEHTITTTKNKKGLLDIMDL